MCKIWKLWRPWPPLGHSCCRVAGATFLSMPPHTHHSSHVTNHFPLTIPTAERPLSTSHSPLTFHSSLPHHTNSLQPLFQNSLITGPRPFSHHKRITALLLKLSFTNPFLLDAQSFTHDCSQTQLVTHHL